MSQVEISTSIGYALKRATWALRTRMDAELRALDLSVSQYASLELLSQRPGLSNAELARAVFVSRQATHQLLSGMTQAGLVRIDGTGRDQRISLTPDGSRRLSEASRAVAAVEQRMIADLSDEERVRMHAALMSCVEALAPADD